MCPSNRAKRREGGATLPLPSVPTSPCGFTMWWRSTFSINSSDICSGSARLAFLPRRAARKAATV